MPPGQRLVGLGRHVVELFPTRPVLIPGGPRAAGQLSHFRRVGQGVGLGQGSFEGDSPETDQPEPEVEEPVVRPKIRSAAAQSSQL